MYPYVRDLTCTMTSQCCCYVLGYFAQHLLPVVYLTVLVIHASEVCNLGATLRHIPYAAFMVFNICHTFPNHFCWTNILELLIFTDICLQLVILSVAFKLQQPFRSLSSVRINHGKEVSERKCYVEGDLGSLGGVMLSDM